MRFQLQGAGVRLDHDQGWLVFTWGRAGSTDGQLAVPPECCVGIAGRPAGHDGGLCLAFRFRPAGAGGPDLVDAEIVVGADRAEEAWRFARWFARTYRVRDLSEVGGQAV